MGRSLTRRRLLSAGAALASVPVGMATALAPWAARATPAAAEKADRIIVVKSERRLYLTRDGRMLKSYRVALGSQPKGTKIYQGDGRTPEGVYRVSAFNPGSRFHRSIRVSYPNEQDVARARALGLAAGGDIMIHGLAPERRGYGPEHWRFNWTNGCIAVTNQEIEEIWHRVEIGTPIEIRP
jgi:murein L,D-transpeptidase YafK